MCWREPEQGLLQRVSGLGEGLTGAVQVGLLNEEVVGVVGGDCEEADVGFGEDGGKLGEDAGEAEVEGAEDFEAAPVGFGFWGVDGNVAGADDGEFVGGFSEEVEGGGED